MLFFRITPQENIFTLGGGNSNIFLCSALFGEGGFILTNIFERG